MIGLPRDLGASIRARASGAVSSIVEGIQVGEDFSERPVMNRGTVARTCHLWFHSLMCAVSADEPHLPHQWIFG